MFEITLIAMGKLKEKFPFLETGLYTGADEFDESVFNGNLNYLKIGRYDEKLGPLNKKTTNQRLYRLVDGRRCDITELFWGSPIEKEIGGE